MDKWIPEIYYEESKEGITSGLPFVKVPQDRSMPSCMFMCEVRDISEEKNDLEKEIVVHSFANMTVLKQELDLETYNKVRLSLGLEALN
tara:strand:- start:928 stop:1194 length:267 start_codon:yes stop_codon:yes gene_type:complete